MKSSVARLSDGLAVPSWLPPIEHTTCSNYLAPESGERSPMNCKTPKIVLLICFEFKKRLTLYLYFM
jgi:hypothetical protein